MHITIRRRAPIREAQRRKLIGLKTLSYDKPTHLLNKYLASHDTGLRCHSYAVPPFQVVVGHHTRHEDCRTGSNKSPSKHIPDNNIASFPRHCKHRASYQKAEIIYNLLTQQTLRFGIFRLLPISRYILSNIANQPPEGSVLYIRYDQATLSTRLFATSHVLCTYFQ